MASWTQHYPHQFFFFQAEDGIRDRDVTGVQTCALPISRERLGRRDEYSDFVATGRKRRFEPLKVRREHRISDAGPALDRGHDLRGVSHLRHPLGRDERSEERRVGKECSARWWP